MKTGGSIQHFRYLRVYQQGRDVAMRVFQRSRDWPAEERYSLTSQIRRSSRSVCANMAEAWRKRRYEAHFISKLSDADAEAAETQSWLDFALLSRYISQQEFDELDRIYETISGGLVRMMVEPQKWCGPANMVREESAEYDVEP
ncbi:MAG: four helix bundle protein [Armatimonadetes bacterium]|nr:four helix bundle protein [Armatimonadota bacterium]